MAKLFALLALIVGVMGGTCPSYSCGNKNAFSDGQCVIANTTSNTLMIQPCKGNLACNTTDAVDNFYCVAPAPVIAANNTLYPGEHCSYAYQCKNNYNCTNGYCSGVALDGDCLDSEECAPGLRCNPDSATCTATLNIGESGCYNEFDCMNGAGCNKNASASTGTCVAYYSLNINANVSNCNDDTKTSSLCSTGSCEVYSALGTEGYCISAIKSPSLQKTCTLDSDCYGVSGNITATGTCSCGYNVNGNAYCDLFPGDSEYTKYISLLVKYFHNAKVNSVCNVMARLNDDCIQQALSVDEYYFLKQYEYASQYYPEIQYNDACVKATYNSYYWDLVNNNNDIDDDDDDDSAGLLALVAAAYLF
mmetsp:Transcript_4832/g.9029  ORF Transcript_4832/g.9029 Transcript_4832/m.9029 type:complete len:363 (+) Transcript_4832:302-1390(+)|eukprot:CAMPEP_0204899580 /NCGR_PEP_ID=MMETSP1397-20131031/1937_1 /ASSEMBLY_ACC=CAM_ASM_000891 /TAXON_ID=49980 /ORGANISM="Climacostomum Climacostomum virens, Strain Stock W-24" /LENGTH=362 /DNA_ID=CAMNT_0052067555 /DNA_START=258 /DNA_END=1346 /DNA_ORIENTATION=+